METVIRRSSRGPGLWDSLSAIGSRVTELRILRAATRVALPLLNEDGTTVEVVTFPEAATADNFGWRVCLTEVHAAGRFAALPDVDCKLEILEGRLSLSVAEREAIELDCGSPAVEFQGVGPTSWYPLEESATFLTLMSRRAHFTADITRGRGSERQMFLLAKSQEIVVIAVHPLGVKVATNRFELDALDAVLLSRGDGRSVKLIPGPESDYIVATITPLGKQ